MKLKLKMDRLHLCVVLCIMLCHVVCQQDDQWLIDNVDVHCSHD